MRVLDKFQVSQAKGGDPRVADLFHHVRSALDIFEQLIFQPVTVSVGHSTQETKFPPPINTEQLGEPKRLTYSVLEASKLMGVGRNSLYLAIQEERIPVLKFGRRMLIPASALHDWINARASKS